MVHAINKCMETTIVEVIYHTTYCIIRCTRRWRCTPMIVVRASVTMGRWHYMIAMWRMWIGMITMRGRRVMIVLGMRLSMMVVVVIIVPGVMCGRIVMSIMMTIMVVVAMTVMMTIVTTPLTSLMITARM